MLNSRRRLAERRHNGFYYKAEYIWIDGTEPVSKLTGLYLVNCLITGLKVFPSLGLVSASLPILLRVCWSESGGSFRSVAVKSHADCCCALNAQLFADAAAQFLFVNESVFDGPGQKLLYVYFLDAGYFACRYGSN